MAIDLEGRVIHSGFIICGSLTGLRHASVPSQKIINHAKETLEYLKTRENFWRQQQPSTINYAPALTTKLGRKIKVNPAVCKDSWQSIGSSLYFVFAETQTSPDFAEE